MNDKLLRSSDVVWEELDGQALLVHSETGERWSLNAAALNIWRHCDGVNSIAEISRKFALCGKEATRRAQAEVCDFCATLMARGLLMTTTLTHATVAGGSVAMMSGGDASPSFKAMGAGSNPHRRASPRGNSGPG